MKKKKSPKEIIESQRNPKLESLYIKFPGKEMKEISLNREPLGVSEDSIKSSRLIKKDMLKNKEALRLFHKGYTQLHTHPLDRYWDMMALPSERDISRFLINSEIKTMVIAQTDDNTGEVQGYFILRKRKQKYEGKKPPLGTSPYERLEDANKYEKTYNKYSWFPDSPRIALEKLAKKYNLQYRWVPAKEYMLSNENYRSRWKFIKREGLHKLIMMILMLGGLIFLSPNITGNTISNFNQTATNFLGILLLLMGVGGLFYLKKKQSNHITIKIIKNKNLTKKEKELINTNRLKRFGKGSVMDFKKDYEPDMKWFFVKKGEDIVSFGGLRPIKINYLGRIYNIKGICSIISIKKKKGYGRILMQAMLDYSKKTGATLLGFTKKTDFFRKVEFGVKKNFIKRFVYINPKTKEKIYDNDGDGVYYEGKDKLISKILSTKSPIYINVAHW